jgi:thioredoxin:protein disulfide reductase
MNTLKITLLFILFVSQSFAQFGMQEDIVKIKSFSSFDKVYPSGEFKIAVKANVDEEWHINSNTPNEDYLIPSALIIDTSSGIKIKQVFYPKAKDLTLSFSDTPLSVWEEEFYLGALLQLPENIKPGEYRIPLTLEYQACNDVTCLAPTEVTDTLIITVAQEGEPVNEVNQEIINKIDLSYTPVNIDSGSSGGDGLSSMLESSGLFLGLLFVFIGGLALNLTPCVYPLIPITIGYFGGQSEGSTSKLFILGLLFVLGMAITYSVIGVVTALSGAVFGALLQNTIVILIIVAIFIVLSLSMFGVYEFKLPDALVAKAGGAKTGGFGAFFMGLTMGIVAAPCIGPFVLGLVTYVAAKADPYFGFLMFFVLALGLGTPYLFLAIFSGKIKKLPRAGIWMEGVKHVFGFILIGMALYFLLPLLPKEISGYVLPVYMIGTAIYLLFFEKIADNVKGFRIFRIAFSVFLIAIAAYALYPTSGESIKWEQYSDKVVPASFEEKRGMIIDFYADWCIPCKELDALTFSDPAVVKQAEGFYTFKADMTKSLSPEVEMLRNKYKIIGVPTVLVINSRGEEVERITGFVGPEEFLTILDKTN